MRFRTSAPGYAEQCRQLAVARKEFTWPAAGSAVVQQHVRRLSRKVGDVWIYKIGWTRFRWSRTIPGDVESCRVTRGRAGRRPVAFTTIPPPVEGPGVGKVVGIDRGVAVSAALSTGELLSVHGLRGREVVRLGRLQRRPARTAKGSDRRQRVKIAIARLKARGGRPVGGPVNREPQLTLSSA